MSIIIYNNKLLNYLINIKINFKLDPIEIFFIQVFSLMVKLILELIL
jgi:hypothetical protein